MAKETKVWSNEAVQWFLQGIIDRARLEYSKRTTLVFHDGGKVYALNVPEVPANVVQLSTASNGDMQARIYFHVRDKHIMRNNRETYVLGNHAELEAECKAQYERIMCKPFPKRRNFGWVAEYAVWKNVGRADQWKPDNRKFWLYPDIVIGGNAYQIKGEDAEYFNESNLASARKWEKSEGL